MGVDIQLSAGKCQRQPLCGLRARRAAGAVLGLRWFRDRTSPDALARNRGISRATACRYRDKVIAVLAQEAPELAGALHRAQEKGLPHVILDGTITPAGRCREKTISVQGEAIDLRYSGKAHRHGGNVPGGLRP